MLLSGEFPNLREVSMEREREERGRERKKKGVCREKEKGGREREQTIWII